MEECMGKIGVLLGSKSDLPKIQGLFDVLNYFELQSEVKIMSAHRTPNEAVEYVSNASKNGISILMGVAGGAAHLPGVMASHTKLPVIGIPIANPPHGGMDAILSILEMPKGVPVATVGASSGGPGNAGLLAARILALSDESVSKRYDQFVEEQRQKVLSQNS
jgi:5-(carboxyamino)imidazole ribonucleotide mutase